MTGVQTCALPISFCESIIRRAEGTRPSYPVLAKLLSEGGFVTPRGNTHWWPAQVQQLLNGSYDQNYRRRSPTSPNNCGR